MSYSNCLRFPSEGSGVEVSSLTPFTSSSSFSSGNIVYNKDFQIYDTQRGGNQPSRKLKKRAPTSSPQYIRFRNQPHSQLEQSDSSEVRSFHKNQQEQALQTYTQGQVIGSENYKWQALPPNTTGYCMQPSYDQSTDGHSYPVVAHPSGSNETAFTLANINEYSCALPSLRVEQTTGAQFYNSYPPPLPTTTCSWQFQNGYYQPDHPSSTITSKAYPFNTLLAPHKAMQVFAADRQYLDDAVPEFGHSSRHSMSSMGNASPATPPTLDDNVDDSVMVNTSSNPAHTYAGNRAHSHLQLFRTESQAFQDELYNPSQEQPTPKPTAKPTSTYISPRQTVMSERLQAANNIRSQSPGSVMSRDRSPFRDNSPYAAHVDWRSPAGMGTAASMRKYLKEQTEQAEYAQLMPKLKREPTKTMSPKDAMLDGNDGDQPSLFQDSIPMGYKQHNTGESWFQNMSSDTNTSFRPMQPMPAVTMSFRPDTTTTLPADTFSFGNMAQPSFSGASVPTVALSRVRSNQYLAPADATPHFPPTLTSMESSISDNGPSSSADSIRPIQRPADTRANTGTYTCTYHGCIERFHSQMELQKHKREVHRTQQYLSAESQSSPRGSTGSSLGDDDASAVSNESPRSSASPEPTGSGMTSAALLARNSQAGPHKCTRNNPTTGKPCNTIFSRPYDLTRHEDTIHNNRKEKVRCELCREEKTFSRNDALTRHMRVVHPEVESYGKRGRRD